MPHIGYEHLSIMLLPLLIVGIIYHRWTKNGAQLSFATVRMVAQLLAVGYVLVFLFERVAWYYGAMVLTVMVGVASHLILRQSSHKTVHHYMLIVATVAISGGIQLVIMLFGVLGLTVLYDPQYLIPLAGMVFANAMNVLSLFIERFEREVQNSAYETARGIAFKAALIPLMNTFLAVGLVSLPGMMTGQILSGVDPLVAVRYQIAIMAMIFSSSSTAVIVYAVARRCYSV